MSTPIMGTYEFLVSGLNTGDKLNPSVTALKNGQFVVVWMEENSNLGDASGTAIHAQLYTAGLSKDGNPFRVNSGTFLNQEEPEVTALDNGGFVVTWQSDHTPGLNNDSDVYARVFDGSGVPAGADFQVNGAAADTQSHAAITTLSDGKFIVAWTDHTGGDNNIRFQMYHANGAPAGGVFNANSVTAGDQDHASIAPLSNGRFIVTWETDAGSNSVVTGRVFKADGTPQTAEFQIGPIGEKQQSTVTELSDGRFVAAWTETNDSNRIHAQIFDANGIKVGNDFLAVSAVHSTFSPSIAATVDGDFVITWHQYEQGNLNYDVYGQKFHGDDGSKDGWAFKVNLMSSGSQGTGGNPVATLADGRMVVVYTDDSNSPDSPTGIVIRGEIIDPRDHGMNITGDNNLNDQLFGTDFNDTMKGGGGADQLFGGGGNDVIEGGAGADYLFGGDDTDTAIYISSASGVKVNLQTGAGTGGDAQGDVLSSTIENLTGSDYNDELTGSAAANALQGNDGADRLNGKAGADVLTGGSGKDDFVFDATAQADAAQHVFDTVTDYSAGDQIDLSAVLGAAFGAGQAVNALVRVSASGSDANLQIDADGSANGVKWLTIAHLNGVHAGDTVNVILGSGSPAGSNVTVVPDLPPSSSMFSLGEFGAMNSAGGWASQDQFPRLLGDVNGDGMDDIIGFGNAGASVALATGGGNFATAITGINEFGAAVFGGGWTTQDQFPRLIGDVNGDGMDDIVGFGNAGASVALATGGGHFATAIVGIYEFGAANFGGGWTTQDQFPRALADVNGDGMADIIGFGNAGVTVALATGGGHFAAGSLKLAEFGSADFGGGWASQDQFPRAVADVNGDGMADIIGFGNAGVTVALATGGGNFAPGVLKLAEFGAANFGGGWSTQDQFPRFVGDVNGDGKADIVGFGNAGASVALATGGGAFGASVLAVDAFGATNDAGGWMSENLFPRELGDVDGNGTADIVGFGNAGVTVSDLHGFLL